MIFKWVPLSWTKWQGAKLKVSTGYSGTAWESPSSPSTPSSRRGTGGVWVGGDWGGLPRRWATSISLRVNGGTTLTLSLKSDSSLSSRVPGLSSGRPNTRIEPFLPCCSRSSILISKAWTWLCRFWIVSSARRWCRWWRWRFPGWCAAAVRYPCSVTKETSICDCQVRESEDQGLGHGQPQEPKGQSVRIPEWFHCKDIYIRRLDKAACPIGFSSS